MTDEGYNVNIKCDHEKTGFCFGGNQHNCGTWMDKMGSSEEAGNRGKPATPRDGAPIELVAMQYSILSWLADLNQQGVIKQDGVKFSKNQGKEELLTFKEWAQKIKDNFEKCFWVPQEAKDDDNYDINKQFVHRRGIYKDVYRSTCQYADYQLRPNVCIAMSYAPELFDP